MTTTVRHLHRGPDQFQTRGRRVLHSWHGLRDNAGLQQRVRLTVGHDRLANAFYTLLDFETLEWHDARGALRSEYVVELGRGSDPTMKLGRVPVEQFSLEALKRYGTQQVRRLRGGEWDIVLTPPILAVIGALE